jgi:hypothetical protein
LLLLITIGNTPRTKTGTKKERKAGITIQIVEPFPVDKHIDRQPDLPAGKWLQVDRQAGRPAAGGQAANGKAENIQVGNRTGSGRIMRQVDRRQDRQK